MSIIIRGTAARDISGLVAGYRSYSSRSAVRFAAALTRAIKRLERMPLSGSELGPSADGSVMFRFVTVRGYRHVVVIHLPLPAGVDVLRVVDGRRDLDAIIAALSP